MKLPSIGIPHQNIQTQFKTRFAVFVSSADPHWTKDVCKPQNSWDITDFEYLCFLSLFDRARFVCWLCFLTPYFLFQGQIFSYMELPFLTALKSGVLLMAISRDTALDSLFIFVSCQTAGKKDGGVHSQR